MVIIVTSLGTIDNSDGLSVYRAFLIEAPLIPGSGTDSSSRPRLVNPPLKSR